MPEAHEGETHGEVIKQKFNFTPILWLLGLVLLALAGYAAYKYFITNSSCKSDSDCKNAQVCKDKKCVNIDKDVCSNDHPNGICQKGTCQKVTYNKVTKSVCVNTLTISEGNSFNNYSNYIILKATYGADACNLVDVTDKLKTIATGPAITVSNDISGSDPCPNHQKALIVTYTTKDQF